MPKPDRSKAVWEVRTRGYYTVGGGSEILYLDTGWIPSANEGVLASASGSSINVTGDDTHAVGGASASRVRLVDSYTADSPNPGELTLASGSWSYLGQDPLLNNNMYTEFGHIQNLTGAAGSITFRMLMESRRV